MIRRRLPRDPRLGRPDQGSKHLSSRDRQLNRADPRIPCPRLSAEHMDRYLKESEWRFKNRDNPYHLGTHDAGSCGASWCVASVSRRGPKHLPSVPHEVIAVRLGI